MRRSPRKFRCVSSVDELAASNKMSRRSRDDEPGGSRTQCLHDEVEFDEWPEDDRPLNEIYPR